MLHDILSERESLVDHAMDAMVETDAFSAKLQQFAWLGNDEGVFRQERSFINLMLGVSTRIERRYIEASGADHHAQPGEILFIPGGADLYCNWTKGGGRVLSCSFDAAAICERGGLEWRLPSFDLNATLGLRNPYVSAAMRRIAEELRHCSFTSDLQIESALTFVVLELQKDLSGLAPSLEKTSGGLSIRQIRVIQDMVLAGDGRVLTIARLAEACGCSPRSLASQYRRTTGVTLREFIAQARIAVSQRLLLEPGPIVKQVAYLSGFQTAAAFTAAFREATGMTPSAFRAINGVATH
jgi:AraC family transcriptional regulator